MAIIIRLPLSKTINSNNPGTKGTLNLFAQEAEPDTKQGIWIKTAIAKQAILITNTISSSLTLGEQCPNIPYDFYRASATVLGTDIYLVGSDVGTAWKSYFYKYDTLAKTYHLIKNHNYVLGGSGSVTIGTKIYMIGVGSGNIYDYILIYDATNNTFAFSGKKLPTSYSMESNCVAIGNKIYMLLSSGSSYYMYCYDTIQDEITKLSTQSIFPSTPKLCAVGNTIYIFGNSSSTTYYKYNLTSNQTSNQFEEKTNLPYTFWQGEVIAVGTEIYLFGGNKSKRTIYKYDTVTDTFIKQDDLPYDFWVGSVVKVHDKIHLLGGGGSSYPNTVRSNQIYNVATNKYNANDFVVLRKDNYNGLYKTELISTNDIINENSTNAIFQTGFDNAWIYADGELKEYPTYYGDGTTWIKFKN